MNHIKWPVDVIQDGHRDLEKSRDTSSINHSVTQMVNQWQM